MAKLPELEVSLSRELDAYGRRVLSRVGVGVAASLIGCGCSDGASFLSLFKAKLSERS